MAIIDFPPIENADSEGVLASGGDLDVESLILAYSRGIFPWPHCAEYPLLWFSPDPRGVIYTKDFHISKSLKKIISKNIFEVKYNTNFREVVKECALAKNRAEGQGTWITTDIIDAYENLFKIGHAYSVETYLKDQLVGGMYGVKFGKFISGESMFYKESNASKVALANLMLKLEKDDIKLLDTQMLTSVVESMGGIEIPRNQFITELENLFDIA